MFFELRTAGKVLAVCVLAGLAVVSDLDVAALCVLAGGLVLADVLISVCEHGERKDGASC